MKKQKSAFHYFLCSLLLAFVVGVLPAAATAESIASVKLVSGVVELLRAGKLPAIKASAGDSLSAGDLVRTKSGGYAEVQYNDGTLLKIAQRSRVDIGDQAGGQGNDFSNARLVRGKVQAIVEPPVQSAKARRFEIRTPNAVAGVRGTDFVVTFQRNVTGVLVRRGTVYTYNRQLPDRVVNVTQSTLTTITAGYPPLKARPATKSEIDRIEKDIAPQPERKSGDSSSGSTTASAATTKSQQQTSSEVIPADIPISVSGGASAVIGGAPPKTVQSIAPVYNPASVQQPVVIAPPPPPPPPVPAPQATSTTTAPPATHTNVNVDVKF
jgi:FecR-like protein